MPWKIAKSDGGQFCVFEEGADGEPTGKTLGCHATEAEANDQMTALYAAEPGAAKAVAVRMVGGSDDEIEGAGIPFGGPFQGQDLYGEHFSKATDFAFEWFPGGRPILYHHGLDKDAGISVVGRQTSHEIRADLGVWTKGQLDKSSEYFAAIKDLVKAGKLFFSSGAMAHLVDVDKRSGEIKRWPWVELSLTPTPANLLATVDFATAARHYRSAGLEMPPSLETHSTPVASRGQGFSCIKQVNVDAFWSHVKKGEGGDAHWLWTGAKNTKGYGILEVDGQTVRAHRVAYEMEHGAIPDGKDVGHKTTCATTSCVRASHLELVTNEENARERSTRKACSRERLKEMASEMDMEMSDEDADSMLAEHPDEGEGEMRKRLAAKKPTKAGPSFADIVSLILEDPGLDPEPVPVGFHAEAVHALAASLAERTKGLQQRRLKEGRVISTANRKRLQDCLESMGGAVVALQALLDSSEPQPAKAASLRRLRAQVVADQVAAMALIYCNCKEVA